jgi:hypothetical protein
MPSLDDQLEEAAVIASRLANKYRRLIGDRQDDLVRGGLAVSYSQEAIRDISAALKEALQTMREQIEKVPEP